MGRQRHGLVATGSFDPVVLPLEGDGLAVECDQAAVGDGDAVGIRSAERLLGIDDPLGLAQGADEGGKRFFWRNACSSSRTDQGAGNKASPLPHARHCRAPWERLSGSRHLLRRQCDWRRYVLRRRWRSNDGFDVCHVAGTNLRRLANVGDNFPPSVHHRLSRPVTVRRVKRLRIAWVSYKAGGR